MICQCAKALAFGTAALWLMFPLLSSTHRFLAFLKGLAAVGLAAGFVFGASQEWLEPSSQIFAGLVVLGLLLLALPSALAFSGWNCRRHYHPVRLLVWLVVWLLAVSTAVLSPFAVLALLAGGAGALPAFGAAILAGVALQLAILVPFLLLSFASSFYRERLKQYLRMEIAAPPPVAPPPLVTTSTP